MVTVSPSLVVIDDVEDRHAVDGGPVQSAVLTPRGWLLGRSDDQPVRLDEVERETAGSVGGEFMAPPG